MYEVYLLIGDHIICEVLLKSITQVAKFIDTVDMRLVNIEIFSPKHHYIDAIKVKELWNA